MNSQLSKLRLSTVVLINNFNNALGKIFFKQKTIILNTENLIEKGCKLISPEYVYGVATYVGMETKIMLNQTKLIVKNSAFL